MPLVVSLVMSLLLVFLGMSLRVFSLIDMSLLVVYLVMSCVMHCIVSLAVLHNGYCPACSVELSSKICLIDTAVCDELVKLI